MAEAAKAATEAEAAQEAEEAEACLCRRRRTARRTEPLVTLVGSLGVRGNTTLGARGPSPRRFIVPPGRHRVLTVCRPVEGGVKQHKLSKADARPHVHRQHAPGLPSPRIPRRWLKIIEVKGVASVVIPKHPD